MTTANARPKVDTRVFTSVYEGTDLPYLKVGDRVCQLVLVRGTKRFQFVDTQKPALPIPDLTVPLKSAAWLGAWVLTGLAEHFAPHQQCTWQVVGRSLFNEPTRDPQELQVIYKIGRPIESDRLDWGFPVEIRGSEITLDLNNCCDGIDGRVLCDAAARLLRDPIVAELLPPVHVPLLPTRIRPDEAFQNGRLAPTAPDFPGVLEVLDQKIFNFKELSPMPEVLAAPYLPDLSGNGSNVSQNGNGLHLPNDAGEPARPDTPPNSDETAGELRLGALLDSEPPSDTPEAEPAAVLMPPAADAEEHIPSADGQLLGCLQQLLLLLQQSGEHLKLTPVHLAAVRALIEHTSETLHAAGVSPELPPAQAELLRQHKALEDRHDALKEAVKASSEYLASALVEA